MTRSQARLPRQTCSGPMWRTALVAVALAFGTVVPVVASDADSDARGDLPRVLILGDSISIGYTPFVQEMMDGEAVVVRPTKNGRPENCQGTTSGVANIDRWLAIDGGKWDVIHFNWGLHDLKRVDPDTGKNSERADHPRQAEPEIYARQLREIVGKLEATGAALVFATTTPFPDGVSPRRDPEDAARYNEAARDVVGEMKTPVAVNDLYAFALPRLADLQRPANVHFTPEGSKALAGEVVRAVRAALGEVREGETSPD